MSRISLNDEKDKRYVWDKPLVIHINKNRRATDIDPEADRDRRLSIERRGEFKYDDYTPELRAGGYDRRKMNSDRRKH